MRGAVSVGLVRGAECHACAVEGGASRMLFACVVGCSWIRGRRPRVRAYYACIETDRAAPSTLQIKLSEYIGKKYVVLFFYPLDFTFVCPTGIRDDSGWGWCI